MAPGTSETEKRAGVFYALTDDAIELPIIDITHEAFGLEAGITEQQKLAESLRLEMKAATSTPPEAIRAAAEQSIIMRGLIAASAGMLGGMTSYMLRLGPANLGKGYASPIDYRLVTGFNAVTMRLRLQAAARAIADYLRPLLSGSQMRQLQLINIGGGAAPDSINALILLSHEPQSTLLTDREVTIRVFDSDSAGPAFAARAVQALRSEGAPLSGVNAVFAHTEYDWNDPAELGAHLAATEAENAIVGVSSEGGLFEYGSDEAIRNNLEVLAAHTPDDVFLIATAIRDGELPRELLTASSLHVRIIEMDALFSLAESSGWTLEIVPCQNLMYEIVRLKKRLE